ncbi:MAG: hypothetical protein PWP30_2261 [Eubacteriaceae bacterium]|nr:hypothetical protein [Eubacteriaceae bacterium]
MLKVINTPIKEKPDFEMIYLEAFRRCMIVERDNPGDRDNLKRTVYYLVKYFNHLKAENIPHNLDAYLIFMEACNNLIGQLTPAEFMTIFPVSKIYDGERWQSKDYFYTMEMIRDHGLDNPIGNQEEVFNFMWDYVNGNVSEYAVQCMCLISKKSEIQTGKSTMEQFIEDQELDIPIYRRYTDSDGKSYLVDENGQSFPLQKPIPRYLKLVQ